MSINSFDFFLMCKSFDNVLLFVEYSTKTLDCHLVYYRLRWEMYLNIPLRHSCKVLSKLIGNSQKAS